MSKGVVHHGSDEAAAVRRPRQQQDRAADDERRGGESNDEPRELGALVPIVAEPCRKHEDRIEEGAHTERQRDARPEGPSEQGEGDERQGCRRNVRREGDPADCVPISAHSENERAAAVDRHDRPGSRRSRKPPCCDKQRKDARQMEGRRAQLRRGERRLEVHIRGLDRRPGR